nr:GLPGLI family protein [uncultured Sediminibacterium sp.]
MKLKYRLLTFVILLLAGDTIRAQDFVTKGKIYYEKKDNMRKQFARSNAQLPNGMVFPESVTSFFELTFSGERALYKAGKEETRLSEEMDGQDVSFGKTPNIMYSHYGKGQRVVKKQIIQETLILEDSISPVQWKIEQETRSIAGYNCRKAIGRIFDTLYVVAFYAEELVIKGGPEGFSGLPGMILQLAIPRLSSVWTATKIELAEVDESEVAPPTTKGKRLTKEEQKAKLKKMATELGIADPEAFAKQVFASGYFL